MSEDLVVVCGVVWFCVGCISTLLAIVTFSGGAFKQYDWFAIGVILTLCLFGIGVSIICIIIHIRRRHQPLYARQRENPENENELQKLIQL